jgi:hypothetical protein
MHVLMRSIGGLFEHPVSFLVTPKALATAAKASEVLLPLLLVLIADDVPDSDGYAYRVTGRTIQDKVPVTIDSSVAYGSNVVHRHRAYCNCVGFASLELEGRKLYASFEVSDNVQARFNPFVLSSGGETEKSGENELTIDPTILSITLSAAGNNSDDRIPEIEL